MVMQAARDAVPAVRRTSLRDTPTSLESELVIPID
jgi:hypothetical protein